MYPVLGQNARGIGRMAGTNLHCCEGWLAEMKDKLCRHGTGSGCTCVMPSANCFTTGQMSLLAFCPMRSIKLCRRSRLLFSGWRL